MTAMHRFSYIALRRPILLVLVFMLRSSVALGLSWPWVTTLAPDSIVAYPKGARELFEPGAAVLLRIVADQQHKILRLARSDVLLGIIVVLVGSVISASVLANLALRTGPRWTIRWRASLRVAPSIVGISIAYWLCLAVIFYFAKLLYPVIPALVYAVGGEKGADVALLVLASMMLLAGFMVLVVSDLARAAAAKAELEFVDALLAAVECLKTQPRRCLLSAVGWIAPMIAGPPIVELCLSSIHSNARGQLLVLLIAHQVTILASCVLHLCWWSTAIDLVQVPAIQ